MNSENPQSVLIIWIVSNVILVVYAIGLFVYGKFYGKKDVFLYVNNNKITFFRKISLNLKVSMQEMIQIFQLIQKRKN